MIVLILNTLTFVLMIIVNAFSNILPLNGKTTGEISNQLDVLITPAGFTFSIWSFIYIMCTVWIIRQFPNSRRHLPLYRVTSPYFIISNLLNSAWIFLWHYEQVLASVIVMILLLLTLIMLYVNCKKVEHTLLDILPFSIYLAWISVATIVNIAYYLKYIGWNGFGLSDVIWTVCMMAVATGLAILFRYSQDDWIYPLVIGWSLFGIGMKNLDISAVVTYSAFAFAALVIIIIPFLRKKNKSSWSYRS